MVFIQEVGRLLSYSEIYCEKIPGRVMQLNVKVVVHSKYNNIDWHMCPKNEHTDKTFNQFWEQQIITQNSSILLIN